LAPQPFAGRGGTVRLLTHAVPLPAGPWREAARWTEQRGPTSPPYYFLTLVQERDGRAVAAIRLEVRDSFGAGRPNWGTPWPCGTLSGRVASRLVATSGVDIDCWQVRQRGASGTPLARLLGDVRIAASTHALGDARTLLIVEYAFTETPSDRVAAWAPAAHSGLREGFSGRGGLTEGLPAP
jgi:hypothetical protein